MVLILNQILLVLDLFLESGILKVVFLFLPSLHPSSKVFHLLPLVGMDHFFSLQGFNFSWQIP